MNAITRSGVVERPSADYFQVGSFDRSKGLVDISIVIQERKPVCVCSGERTKIHLRFMNILEGIIINWVLRKSCSFFKFNGGFRLRRWGSNYARKQQGEEGNELHIEGWELKNQTGGQPVRINSRRGKSSIFYTPSTRYIHDGGRKPSSGWVNGPAVSVGPIRIQEQEQLEFQGYGKITEPSDGVPDKYIQQQTRKNRRLPNLGL